MAQPLQAEQVVEFEAHDFQLQMLESDKEMTFVGAGVGVGKTEAGTLWLMMRAAEAPKGVLGILAANTYTQLFDSTLRKVFHNLDTWGVPHRPREIPKSHGPLNLEIWNGSHWAEVLCRSMDAYENLSGIDAGYFWMDEVWQTEVAAYNLITARMRDKRMKNRGLLTTTLDDPGSWMYEEFVTKHNPETQLVIYAPTEINRDNLAPGYIERLQATYSAREAERMLGAKWVFLTGSTIYYAFARAINHTAEAEFDPALPVLWSHDFNIGQGKPMSSCLAQIKKGAGPPKDGKPTVRPELHVFDELILDTSDTNDAAEECVARLAALGVKKNGESKVYGGVRVYGDASGKAKDTRSKKTDYEILRAAGFVDQRVPDANPPIRDRHNAVNALLKNAAGDARLKIHPRCRALVKGLETVKLRSGAQYLEEETREQHLTTALGYLVNVEFPIVRPVAAQVTQRPW